MALVQAKDVDNKLIEAVTQINHILASYDERISDLEAKLVEKEETPTSTRKKVVANG